MRKRGFQIYSDGSGCSNGHGEVDSRAPLGQLADVWAAKARTAAGTRRPLMRTDVNVSSVFQSQLKRQSLEDGSGAGGKSGKESLTLMQGVLRSAKTVASWPSTVSCGAGDVSRDEDESGDLLQEMNHGLAKFKSRVRVASGDDFDRLIEFEELRLLSAHELLVMVRGCQPIVLHSKGALCSDKVDRFVSMKLAINSQCYYVLYNDVYWYMRWKFF